MAKGNLFLGQAKGKVGSVVFSRAYGEQITRTKPTSVANPKTIGQNTQRAILATIAKDAALLTPIVDHSFANVAYGAESVRHFRKLNMGILRNMVLSAVGVNYNLSAKGANAVPNALKVSEGNLPAFASAYQSDVVSFYQNGALEDIAEVPVSTFREAYPYLQGGDQLTLVKVVKTAGSLVDGDASFALKFDRMVLAPDAFDDAASEMITDEGFINESKLDLTKTTNKEMLVAQSGAAGNGLGAATDSDNTYAAALILSRKVNNVWQRSTQFLVLTEFDDATDNQAAIDSYGATASLAEATEYLNQADESTSVSGLSGAYANVVVMVNGEEQFTGSADAGEIQSTGVTIPASANFSIKVLGFGAGDARLVTCEIQGPDNTSLAHGTPSTRYSANWQAGLAGVYKLIAVFADGTRAEYDITLSQQS